MNKTLKEQFDQLDVKIDADVLFSIKNQIVFELYMRK